MGAILFVFIAAVLLVCVYTIFTTQYPVLRLIAFGAGAYAVYFLPRWQRLDKDVNVVTRSEAPNLFETVDRVTSAANSTPIQRIVLTGETNAGMLNTRTGPVLFLGAPLVFGLAANEFVALVAHEIGHLGRFQRWSRSLSISGLTALHYFHEFLSVDGKVRKVFAVPVESFANSYSRWMLTEWQLEEYGADFHSAEIAGTAAVLSLHRRMLADEAVNTQIRTWVTDHIARNGFAVPLASSFLRRVQDFSLSVPNTELERVLHYEMLEAVRDDATHPPTMYRIDVLRAGPGAVPKLTVTDEAFERVLADIEHNSAGLLDEIVGEVNRSRNGM
jgi:heat shock protein HtpX